MSQQYYPGQNYPYEQQNFVPNYQMNFRPSHSYAEGYNYANTEDFPALGITPNFAQEFRPEDFGKPEDSKIGGADFTPGTFNFVPSFEFNLSEISDFNS